jgi:hypothetical protein
MVDDLQALESVGLGWEVLLIKKRLSLADRFLQPMSEPIMQENGCFRSFDRVTNIFKSIGLVDESNVELGYQSSSVFFLLGDEEKAKTVDAAAHNGFW